MKTDSNVLLGRILQRMIDQGFSQVEGYNKFTFVEHFSNRIIIGRESGKDTPIYFDKMIHVIEAYQNDPDDYDLGPGKTRDYGIIHVNSPIWSMLHLLDKIDYER